jgi:hypoxanthine phosphoribosyltransferase
MVEKLYITYNHYGKLITELTNKLKSTITPEIQYIYGPPRGSLPIAVHLAHHLDLQLIETCRIYNSDINNQTLIVDDICDSGKTFSIFHTIFPNSIYAVLFVKPRRKFKDVIYVKEVENNTWVVFPWEKDDSPDKEYMKNKD